MVGDVMIIFSIGVGSRIVDYYTADNISLKQVNSVVKYGYCQQPDEVPCSVHLERLPIQSLIITNTYTQPCDNCVFHLSELHDLHYLSIGDNCFQYFSTFIMDRMLDMFY